MLASNTSYLDLDAIAAATSRPQDVLGLHFFSPANVMKLMEVVRGRQTAPDVLATGLAFGEAAEEAAGAVPGTPSASSATASIPRIGANASS